MDFIKQNCLIVAGEKSGEEHCLSFFEELKSRCPDVHFWGVGGDELANRGMELLYHLKDFSSWGFSEVISKIPFYIKALKNLEKEVVRRGCKTVILIDFQDFNMRLAKRLQARGVNVLYYVAPQAWVWKQGRVKVLEKVAHTLFTIIPFEKRWFMERGVKNVVSVEHPVLTTYKDRISNDKLDQNIKNFANFSERVNLLLLPGSRNFEVQRLLPEFIEAIHLLKKNFNLHISLVKSPNVDEKYYIPHDSLIDEYYGSDQLASALEKSDLALASSGTVTLTCALFQVPTVICYKVSLLNEVMYKMLVSYKGPIGLANIVHEQMVFPELLQKEAEASNIAKSARVWLTDQNEYEKIKRQLATTQDRIKGDSLSVPEYMAGVIHKSYDT